PRQFEASSRVMSRPGIQHLTLTPEAALDLAHATGIRSSFVIYNCNSLPEAYLDPVAPIDPPVVLNVASVQPRKGPDLFIDVAAEVCGEHPSVKFVWVGGHPTEALTMRIKDYGLENRVEFVGRVMPPYQWIQRASVVFFSSRSEAFGLAVAEAMACYRTVCCFQGTGAEFVVGDTGIVVPRFNTSLAAQRIVEELNRPSPARINVGARHRYDALFSPRSFAQRLSMILQEPQYDEALFVAPL
ncbi:MAG: glycosyltransferase family 4 protein, partial [Candidatus Binatia bacterium]